jgi:hypothetical protein
MLRDMRTGCIDSIFGSIIDLSEEIAQGNLAIYTDFLNPSFRERQERRLQLVR